MKLEELVHVTGRVHIVVENEVTGEKREYDFDNLTVTVGKAWIAARMKDTGLPTQMTYMASGTNSTAAAAGDTALGAEVARVALATPGGTVASTVVTYVATFLAGVGTGAITEAAILNAASLGTMLCRTVFGVVTKGVSDVMTITWTVTVN